MAVTIPADAVHVERLRRPRARTALAARLAARVLARSRRATRATSTSTASVTLSVLVVRGDDGELRAFQNACRHRGSALCEGTGTGLAEIRCPFHRWTYDLSGRLREVPVAARVRRSRERATPASSRCASTRGARSSS